MEDYFWLVWGCVLIFAVIMVGLAKPGERLRTAVMLAIAILLTYLILEVHLPIVHYIIISLMVFVLLFVGLILWLMHRMNNILQELWNAQQEYQANHNPADYLSALEKCSRQLQPIKWLSSNATVKLKTKKSNGNATNDDEINHDETNHEMKLFDYLAQQKQLAQAELEKNK